MPRGRQPQGEHPLSNAERQARYRAAANLNSRSPYPAISIPPTEEPGHSVSAMPSPRWWLCKPDTPSGATPYLTAYATPPTPRRYRPLSISISTTLPPASPRADKAAIEVLDERLEKMRRDYRRW